MTNGQGATADAPQSKVWIRRMIAVVLSMREGIGNVVTSQKLPVTPRVPLVVSAITAGQQEGKSRALWRGP